MTRWGRARARPTVSRAPGSRGAAAGTGPTPRTRPCRELSSAVLLPPSELHILSAVRALLSLLGDTAQCRFVILYLTLISFS